MPIDRDQCSIPFPASLLGNRYLTDGRNIGREVVRSYIPQQINLASTLYLSFRSHLTLEGRDRKIIWSFVYCLWEVYTMIPTGLLYSVAIIAIYGCEQQHFISYVIRATRVISWTTGFFDSELF